MKKVKKRQSKVASGKRAKSRVFKGDKEKTSGGLKKKDLMKNKDGKIVSKKLSGLGKSAYVKNGIGKWIKCVAHARKALGIKGFQIVGGKSKEGQQLYNKARSMFMSNIDKKKLWTMVIS